MNFGYQQPQLRQTDKLQADLTIARASAAAPWLVPVLRAARDGRIALAVWVRGTEMPARRLKRARIPCLTIIGDDDGQSCGPSGWPRLHRLRSWTQRVFLHAAGGDAGHYGLAADAAVLCGALVLVETDTDHAPAWRTWAGNRLAVDVRCRLDACQAPARETVQ